MRRTVLAAAAGIAIIVAQSAAADTLADIEEAGKIVVGVKQDYRPWGYLDEQGNIVGLEIDLAQDIADRLGVELELVPVVGSNRMEFLQQGRIDLIIATMGDNPQRREVVGMIEPNYYAGGTNILAPEGAEFTAWEDLRGKDVCGIQGAYYNRRVTEEYGVNVVAFAGVPEASAALANGSCAAFVYDNTWIESQLANSSEWDGYEMSLPTEDPQGWAIAVPLGEVDGPYGEKMSEIVTDWHRSGFLMERNAHWEISENPFLVEQNASLN